MGFPLFACAATDFPLLFVLARTLLDPGAGDVKTQRVSPGSAPAVRAAPRLGVPGWSVRSESTPRGARAMIKNPSGACCLGDVNREIKEAKLRIFPAAE